MPNSIMPNSLKDALKKHQKANQVNFKDWQGRTHYHSPREAESWDTPEQHLMRFEQKPVDSAMHALSDYRNDVLHEKNTSAGAYVFAERKARAMEEFASDRAQKTAQASAATNAAEMAFDLDEAAAKHRKRSWIRRLFSRK